LFIIRLKPDSLEIDRNAFIEQLKEAGVGTSVHFIPLHRHQFYRERYGYESSEFPHAEDAFSRCLSLPIYPNLKESQVDCIVDAIQQIVCKNRKKSSVAL